MSADTQVPGAEYADRSARLDQSATPQQPPPPPADESRVPNKPSSGNKIPGRLTKIEIENYRAFTGRFELDLPNGCNLLVYGENGAGKSSLFHSLTDFLESPDRQFYDHSKNASRALKYDDHRHRFNTAPTLVRLTFSQLATGEDTPAPPKVYEWSDTTNDPKTSEMRTVDKGKGCLDYRALLRIHLLQTGQREVDLFPLFIQVLFRHFRNPVSTTARTFAEEWSGIKRAFRPYARQPKDLAETVATFNAGFGRTVEDAFRTASELLTTFDRELVAGVEFVPARYTWPPKLLSHPRIIARPSFRRLQQPDYHAFLNEARLSALAMAIYFAALTQSPARDLRLLVLDDILIGLDMTNRMAVLRIVEKLFRDWQVIILTYHKAWFEVLKARTSDKKWAHPWRSVTLRLGRSMGAECPIVAKESHSLLVLAKEHLKRGDTKAAAVYARSAWEAVMSWYCAKWRLGVIYAESRRDLDTDAFLSSIRQHLEMLGSGSDRLRASGVVAEIEHARRFVLNPHSHFDPDLEDEIKAEIEDGIRAVEEFDNLLRSLRKDQFAKSQIDRASVGMMLCDAAEHFHAGRNAAAQKALTSAFQQHMIELFEQAREQIPFGAKTTSTFLLTWACRRLYKGPVSSLLMGARPALLGTHSGQVFDATNFQSALRLLVNLRLLFLADMRRSAAK